MKKETPIKKVSLTSSNLSDEKLTELRQILPDVFSEDKLDWDKLRIVLGDEVDSHIEKFGFTWSGKSNAIKNVLIPSKATLNPVPDESLMFDESENLFIEGDNLEVLKLLQKAYFEKIKMIYIDPPYNTGGDFVYKDNFASPVKNYLEQTGQVDSEGNRLSTNKETSGRFHSDWLSMMYPRLKLAWNLLRDDGVIFVSIDDHEAAHLRLLLNEVFGEECYLNTFVWVNNLKGRQIAGTGAAKTYEYVYAYAKNAEQVEGFEAPIEYLKSLMPTSYKGFNYEVESDDNGEFVVKNELYNTNSAFNERTRPNLVFNIFYNPKTKEVRFTNIGDKDIEEAGFKKISPHANNDGVHSFHAWRWGREKIKNETSNLKFIEVSGEMKVFTKVREHTNTNLKDIISDISTTAGGSELKKLFDDKKYFDYPKPVDLIRIFINQTSGEDIILDFFAGSGTTAHAVMKQNDADKAKRKWICVQLPEKINENAEAFKAGYNTIADLATERIRRAAKELGNQDGFKVFRLAESNYPENTFEFNPENTERENAAAFDEYLHQSKQGKLINDIDEISIVYENIVKEGFSLNSKIKESIVGNLKIYTVTDNERQFSVCLDREIDDIAVKNVMGLDKGATFICFDNALTDSAKANLALHVELKTI